MNRFAISNALRGIGSLSVCVCVFFSLEMSNSIGMVFHVVVVGGGCWYCECEYKCAIVRLMPVNKFICVHIIFVVIYLVTKFVRVPNAFGSCPVPTLHYIFSLALAFCI